MTRFEKKFKKGQSAVELSLIAALVVSVSYGGLQLFNSKMTQGTASFAGQFDGKSITNTANNPTNPANATNPVALPTAWNNTGGTQQANPTQGTGSTSSGTGTAPAPDSSSGVVGTLPQSIGTPMSASPVTTTGTNGAAVVSTTPVIPLPVTSTVANNPVSTPVKTSPTNALPAAGDGCMGCAASMTTDLGW